MRILLVVFLLVPSLVPSLAFGQAATKTYPPKYKATAGAELALLSNTWADEGFGVQGHVDAVLNPRVGPGHTTGGAFVLLALADDDDDDGPCDREETILALGGRMKYVADVHPVIRPWGGLGIGVYSVDRDNGPCADPDDDDDVGIGIPLSLGFDFTLESVTLSISINVHGNTTDDDFSHLGLGASWRF